MQILYCYKCGDKLTNDSFEKGEAFHLEGQVSCAACSPNVEATKLNIIAGQPPPVAPVSRRPGAGQSGSGFMEAPAPEPGKPKWLVLAIGGGAGFLVLIIVLALVMGGGPDKHSGKLVEDDMYSVPTPVKPEPPKTDQPKITPRDMVQPRIVHHSAREVESSELAALDSQARNMSARQRFGSALKILEDAKSRHESPTWKPQLDKRIRALRGRIDQAFGVEMARAVDAARSGGNTELLLARVRGWGVKGYPEKLEAEIRRIKDAMAATAELKRMEGYRKPWEEAMALAADRDYGSAVNKLNASMKETTDKKVLAAIIQDVELLRRVRGMYQRALGMLRTWPKSKVVKLEYRDEKGEMKSFGGTVAASGPGWIELKKGKETAWIDLAELAPKSLLEISRAGDVGDPEAVAILSKLEGLKGSAKGLPEKYASYAVKRPAKLPAREITARSLYYSTLSLQRGFPEGRRLGGASDTYRKLLKDFGKTAFVRRHLGTIRKLQAPAAEYVFFADRMKGEGTFRWILKDPVRDCWTSHSSTPATQTLKNYVSLTFDALPGEKYTCWIYAGACCRENYVAYLQGTGLMEQDRRTRKEMAVEPGSEKAAPVTTYPPRIPRTHSYHRSKPDLVKWGWLKVELPKTDVGGKREVRLLTNAKGMNVAYAVASTKRPRAPTEKEMKSMDLRTVVEPRKAGVEGLIAHWTFDEGKGTVAKDSVKGRVARLVQNPRWAQGVSGTALSLNGKKQYAEVPGGQDLLLGLKAFTFSIWIRSKQTSSDRGFFGGIYPDGHDEGFSLRYDKAIGGGQINGLKIGVGISGDTMVIESSGNNQTQDWQHVVISWKSGSRMPR